MTPRFVNGKAFFHHEEHEGHEDKKQEELPFVLFVVKMKRPSKNR